MAKYVKNLTNQRIFVPQYDIVLEPNEIRELSDEVIAYILALRPNEVMVLDEKLLTEEEKSSGGEETLGEVSGIVFVEEQTSQKSSSKRKRSAKE